MASKKYRQRIYLERYKPAYNALMKFYPFTLENLDGEEWRDIEGYEGLYQVSTFGRVKSFKNKKPWILRPALHSTGRLFVTLSKNNHTKNFRIHRLVAMHFIPNPAHKPEINHEDGQPLNCHVSNLTWVFGEENRRHAVQTGLQKRGVDISTAKLTSEQVLFIRSNQNSFTVKRLAEIFNIDQAVIGRIQRGESYKNVGGEIRLKKQHPWRLSDEIRNQIRADYIPKSPINGARALAEKYHISKTLVLKILHEK